MSTPGFCELRCSLRFSIMYTRLALFYLLAFGVRIEASMNFESESAYTSNKAEDLRMTYQVRLACSVCSAISLCASVIGFYWFFRMDKRFRHRYSPVISAKLCMLTADNRLIMILLYGDLIRGFWYFTMAIYSFKRGAPQTKTAMCQVSGFFIQYATETSGRIKQYHPGGVS